MTHPDIPCKTISQLIDEVERIREELFCLQSELEKIESAGNVTTTGERRKA